VRGLVAHGVAALLVGALAVACAGVARLCDASDVEAVALITGIVCSALGVTALGAAAALEVVR